MRTAAAKLAAYIKVAAFFNLQLRFTSRSKKCTFAALNKTLLQQK